MNSTLQYKASHKTPDIALWLLIGSSAVLASEIAAVLSLTFLASQFTIDLAADSLYLVVAPLCGLLVGLLNWWLFIWRPGRATVRRGVLFGALSSVLAHPFTLGIIALLSSAGGPNFFGHQLGSDPFPDLLALLSLSLLTLFYVGWITTVVGAVIGGVLMHLQHRLILCLRQRGD